MKLKSVYIEKYKNLSPLTIDFELGNGLTMLVGNNGSVNELLKTFINRINPDHKSKIECNLEDLRNSIFYSALTDENGNILVDENGNKLLCYGYLDIPDMPKYNYQYTGKKYAEVCAIAKKIAAELKKAGADDYDLLAVDYFMWDEILPLAEKKSPVSPATPEVKKPVTVKDSKSLHDEIKEKLVAIGELLGFDSRSEVKITTGAVVDAVWEAKIGNMGKAIYVFEVQSKGSIDSLILNLKKAQSNAAVQAVVAVADEEQLAKIIRESAGVIDEKSLRTWDSEDVLAVYDSLVRAHESINKLALVPESF